MPILEFFVVIMQWYIIKNIVSSSVWRTKRKQLDSIKAMYCCIIFSSIFSVGIIIASIISKDILEINNTVRALFYSSIIFHSFIVNKSVSIYNRTRLSVSRANDYDGSSNSSGGGELCVVRVPRIDRSGGKLSVRD